MKKGFTMIELIFVIVILGILAAVAIPRLAGTRADAEITSTIANIRTLLSDAATYYVAKGSFVDDAGNYAKYASFTNVPFYNGNGAKLSNTDMQNKKANEVVSLGVGGKGCIAIRVADPSDTNALQNPNGTDLISHATVIFGVPTTANNSSLCNAVRNAEAVKAFTHNVLLKSDGTAYNTSYFQASGMSSQTGAIGIGASASVYDVNFTKGTN